MDAGSKVIKEVSLDEPRKEECEISKSAISTARDFVQGVEEGAGAPRQKRTVKQEGLGI